MSQRVCKHCGQPLLEDGRCEFAQDHYWNEESAIEADQDTRQLWERR